MNNSVIEQYASPISEYENSPESPLHQDYSIYDVEFTMKDVGNLKEYIYFVSLLNQNFSFKDFAILKITDDSIHLAITPKESREKYSKYYFDPEQSITNIGEEALKIIFKESHTVKFQIDSKSSSESVLTDDPLKEKESVSEVSQKHINSTNVNDNSPLKQNSPTQNSIKTENSETFSIAQSDCSRKTNENSEYENNLNDALNDNSSIRSSLSLVNSNDSINRSKWRELLESLNSTKEKNLILQENMKKMKETSDSNVNEIRLLHMRLENDKKVLKSLMNSFSEIEEKSKEQPKSYKNILLMGISGFVLIIAFLYIK
ncbi:hypothetical protein PIROE2DRAFT_61272 [Piromyces sp. E2]|nr:hypothetical protein PIROE2DRAFT_61272 [Piromyces sp. E2]|eukprot:OUM63450.1 hypothetical protein PIROE2DRAFT_61272 [Piromyces sp. E2]